MSSASAKVADPAFMRQLVFRAEQLALEASSKSVPILLQQIAQRRRVTEVVFRPLLVDAVLTTHGTGFRVFFRCGRDEAPALVKAYQAESASALLPSRIRFSLAHELAHTLFYDLSDGRPRAVKFASDAQMDDLEGMCNRLARHLLMPSDLLRAEVGRLPALQPELILEAATRFGVSAEAFVVRLATEPGLLVTHDLRGCVVVLGTTSAGLLTKAIARPRGLNIPAEVKALRVGELWQIGGAALRESLSKAESGHMTLKLTLKTARASEETKCPLPPFLWSQY